MGTRFGEVCQKNSQGKGRPLLFLMQSGADFDWGGGNSENIQNGSTQFVKHIIVQKNMAHVP